jgi:putative redox protein
MKRPPNQVVLNWAGEHRFDAGRKTGGPTIRIDADAQTGPGPVDALLIALGSCTAVDVVDILAKRRTPVESMSVEVIGDRHEGGFAPRRLEHARIVYRIRGAGIERVHAERAIELAVTKYCSVRDSLDPKIPVEWALELNGDADAIADGPVP